MTRRRAYTLTRADEIARPAERLAARLAHGGDKHAAEVIHALIRSHRAQRAALVRAFRERSAS
ncbi:hypothetical protein [Novosphingobium sp. FSW06-99]|uniref:hypothetical protein n=1 Tax=Novosphingobium sp. FSW06-99 TaxID=1739113 RepID=UPI00076D76DA|nr:hypothetical protein [Novosphingobium sp. FSW06-99]KUR80934.1 hypothetical protein AQZ49_02610 [Novosphingobium sp. FSW06-99]